MLPVGNPRDRTIEWEADIVNLFIKTPGKTEFFGHRETPFGTSLYYSAPIRVDDESCLACHGSPDKAPPEMVRLYGTANGFGWKLHEVVGAQIVSVPANLSDRAADAALQRRLWWLVALFGVLFFLVNLAFFFSAVWSSRSHSLLDLLFKGECHKKFLSPIRQSRRAANVLVPSLGLRQVICSCGFCEITFTPGSLRSRH
jgi:hypothetical protein